MKRISKLLSILFALALSGTALAETTLLNVSYDPTRELYQDFNKAFASHWKQKTGETITIKSGPGPGKLSWAEQKALLVSV